MAERDLWIEGGMHMTRRGAISLLLATVSGVLGCARDQRQDVSKDELEALDANARMIFDAAGVDTDCAEGASDTLARLGIGELTSVKGVLFAPNTYKATAADGRVYYLELTEMGYLQVVRADAVYGEVIWGVVQ